MGKLLLYARAADKDMLHALYDIELTASKGNQYNLDATIYFLNYAASNHDTEIIYRKSDMILIFDSNGAYLVATQARSTAGGYHYPSNKEVTISNVPIYVLEKQ